MCLIIQKPAPIKIDFDVLSTGMRQNPHGFGLMFAHEGSVTVFKTMDQQELLEKAIEFEDNELLIHFRTATHGKVDLDNCHPFQVTDDIWLMHNGILEDHAIEANMSDSYHLAKYILKPILLQTPDLYGTEDLEKLINFVGGRSSKFALLHAAKGIQIINKTKGVEWGGMWMSNSYAIPYEWKAAKGNTVTYSYGKGGYHLADDEWEYGYHYRSEPSKPTSTQKNVLPVHYQAKPKAQLVIEAKVDEAKDYVYDDMPQDMEDLLELSYEEMKIVCNDFPDKVADILFDFSIMREEIGREV